MLKITTKFFYFFIYNVFVSIICFFSLKFYFFDKNGHKKISLLKEKILITNEKKNMLKTKKKEIKLKIQKWENSKSIREEFGRSNLDLVKKNEIIINF